MLPARPNPGETTHCYGPSLVNKRLALPITISWIPVASHARSHDSSNMLRSHASVYADTKAGAVASAPSIRFRTVCCLSLCATCQRSYISKKVFLEQKPFDQQQTHRKGVSTLMTGSSRHGGEPGPFEWRNKSSTIATTSGLSHVNGVHKTIRAGVHCHPCATAQLALHLDC